MTKLLCEAVFGFSWDRFTQPGVLSGIAIMIAGMVILITASKLSNYITKLYEKKGKKSKDSTWIFKIIAGVMVLTGALVAILVA